MRVRGRLAMLDQAVLRKTGASTRPHSRLMIDASFSRLKRRRRPCGLEVNSLDGCSGGHLTNLLPNT
jgi:hypothetical protein